MILYINGITMQPLVYVKLSCTGAAWGKKIVSILKLNACIFVSGGLNVSFLPNIFLCLLKTLFIWLLIFQDTLPPYLRTQYKEFSSENRWVGGKWVKIGPTKATVPISERGEELTFPDTGYQKTFMFARSNAFIQLDSNQIPTFQLRCGKT